jgi:hypothetical protein
MGWSFVRGERAVASDGRDETRGVSDDGRGTRRELRLNSCYRGDMDELPTRGAARAVAVIAAVGAYRNAPEGRTRDTGSSTGARTGRI